MRLPSVVACASRDGEGEVRKRKLIPGIVSGLKHAGHDPIFRLEPAVIHAPHLRLTTKLLTQGPPTCAVAPCTPHRSAGTPMGSGP